MEFSLDRFYQLNRKVIIWIVLFLLIYLLRDFFTLIFLTFIISFFAFPASKQLSRRLRLNQNLAVLLVYLIIFSGYIALYVLVLPNVVRQATSIRTKLPSIQAKLNAARVEFSERYPNTAWLFNFDAESSLLSDEEIRDWPAFVQRLLADTPPSPRVRQFLPKDVLAEMEWYAKRLPRPREARTADTNELVEAHPLAAASTNAVLSGPPPDLRDHLVDALNAHIIENPLFFRQEDFRELKDRFKQSPEIELLVERKEKTALSGRAVQRLNRLVLEQLYPSIQKREYQTEKKLNELIDLSRKKVQEHLPNIALYLLKFFANSLLAILFSFLVVLDYGRLRIELKGLAASRLRDFFLEAGQPVAKFAISVGRGFQAIVVIASITAVLTVIALLALRVSSIAFLAVVTFVTGLIPVVGTFLQAIPIVLVALNERGPEGAFWAAIAWAIIHVLVGYVIAPIIFGREFKMNVVAILFILFIGHQVGGVWGMILGIPIANYLLRDVFGVPEYEGKSKPARELVVTEEPSK